MTAAFEERARRWITSGHADMVASLAAEFAAVRAEATREERERCVTIIGRVAAQHERRADKIESAVDGDIFDAKPAQFTAHAKEIAGMTALAIAHAAILDGSPAPASEDFGLVSRPPGCECVKPIGLPLDKDCPYHSQPTTPATPTPAPTSGEPIPNGRT